MNKLFLLLALFSFSATTLSAQNWSETELQEMYMDFLSSEGYDPFIDSDGDVQFTFNDLSAYIAVDDYDQEFFRVVLFNIWPIESQTESVQVAFALDAVNRERKVAKGYTTNDNVYLACELFVSSPDDFKAVFGRCMDELEKSIDTFVEQM